MISTKPPSSVVNRSRQDQAVDPKQLGPLDAGKDRSPFHNQSKHDLLNQLMISGIHQHSLWVHYRMHSSGSRPSLAIFSNIANNINKPFYDRPEIDFQETSVPASQRSLQGIEALLGSEEIHKVMIAVDTTRIRKRGGRTWWRTAQLTSRLSTPWWIIQAKKDLKTTAAASQTRRLQWLQCIAVLRQHQGPLTRFTIEFY